MQSLLDTEESALKYRPRYREYTIDYTDGASVQVINYCPFCGTELPESLFDEWHARLDETGLDWTSPDIPEELRSDRWWREAGL